MRYVITMEIFASHESQNIDKSKAIVWSLLRGLSFNLDFFQQLLSTSLPPRSLLFPSAFLPLLPSTSPPPFTFSHLFPPSLLSSPTLHFFLPFSFFPLHNIFFFSFLIPLRLSFSSSISLLLFFPSFPFPFSLPSPPYHIFSFPPPTYIFQTLVFCD